VEGSVILVETMAQYGAIMVMQKDYTTEKLHKFLRYEMDRYLSARSNEGEKEKPLAYIDQAQSYIRYEKGGVEMYALSHYIGEDSLNLALQRFLKQYAFKGAPYPTSLDLIRYIKQVTPDSMQYFVKDVFENITLYNNKLTDATVTEAPGGQYTINFNVASQKLYADSSGYEKAVPSNDYIEVGVYNDKRKMIRLQRYKLPGGTSKLSMTISEKPAKIVVDPNLLLIDKDLNDNEKRLNVSSDIAKK
jgi:aminopeptidase N